MSSEEAYEANSATLNRNKKLFKEAKELVLSKKYEKAVNCYCLFRNILYLFSI